MSEVFGPLKYVHLKAIVAEVQFRDWKFHVATVGGGFTIQASFVEKDSDSGKEVVCKGRKWYVSTWATSEEVVKTCWLAVEIACRHEAMEAFKYQGVSIFHPHTGLEALLDGAADRMLVDRPDPAVAVIPVEPKVDPNCPFRECDPKNSDICRKTPGRCRHAR